MIAYNTRLITSFEDVLRHDLTIVGIVLNFLTAFRACGSLAGIMIILPFGRAVTFPEIVVSASPSKIYAKASNGVVHWLNSCLSSKENKVTVPAILTINVLRFARILNFKYPCHPNLSIPVTQRISNRKISVY